MLHLSENSGIKKSPFFRVWRRACILLDMKFEGFRKNVSCADHIDPHVVMKKFGDSGVVRKTVCVKQMVRFGLVCKLLIPCRLRAGFFQRPQKTMQNALFLQKSVLNTYRRFFVFGGLWQNRYRDEPE
jgi:hypothetical protein